MGKSKNKDNLQAKAVFNIADGEWERCGEEFPESRLMVSIIVCGQWMFLEAYAVEKRPMKYDPETTVLKAVDPTFEDTVELFHRAMGLEDFQAIEIMGRQYVLIATPYGE